MDELVYCVNKHPLRVVMLYIVPIATGTIYNVTLSPCRLDAWIQLISAIGIISWSHIGLLHSGKGRKSRRHRRLQMRIPHFWDLLLMFQPYIGPLQFCNEDLSLQGRRCLMEWLIWTLVSRIMTSYICVFWYLSGHQHSNNTAVCALCFWMASLLVEYDYSRNVLPTERLNHPNWPLPDPWG